MMFPWHFYSLSLARNGFVKSCCRGGYRMIVGINGLISEDWDLRPLRQEGVIRTKIGFEAEPGNKGTGREYEN